ncbi:NYN domain-containing protein [Herbaspirillum sp. SJZ107]|uniref:NYN domain-containing protein n=1 Tax=Herbaspirillum sp. SJZ107 TaxID=2572881 RepID=UPI0011505B20|nr:NYN domain-containing protein [Herbaspirillum sp. SJZ107]TQK06727.1 NYN domain-containing protein [Herbaspirillum sp. SJZ107]
MTSYSNPPRTTAVYVDGYNLYYGRLRGTAFKWLDLVKLFDTLLAQRDQSETLARLHLFTAPALATFASHGNASVEAQAAYHRALKAKYEDRFETIYGTHSFDKSGTLLPVYLPDQPFDRTNRTRVWKLEEKKTDVNLALRMYRDACKGRYDRMILVSNDSDAEPALEALRVDFPHIMLGVVMPIRPVTAGMPAHRRPSGSLAKQADWTLSHLSDAMLSAAQLPAIIPTKKKPIRKPGHW